MRTFDTKCFDLAGHFLEDCKDLILPERHAAQIELARKIQDTVEDYIADINSFATAERKKVI